MSRYSAITTASELAEVTPEIVLTESIATASRRMVFMPHVRRFDRTGPGDVFHHTQRAALSFGAYSSDGSAPDETAYNPTERTHTPVERVVDVVITRKGLADSIVDINMDIAAEVGIAYAKDVDARFAAIYTEAPASAPDHEIGTDAVPFSADIVRQGEALLFVQRAPRPDQGAGRRGFVFIMHPTQYSELVQDDKFTNASRYGAPTVVTEGVREDGWFGDYLNSSLFECDQIVESSGLHAMHFSRQNALGWTFKRIGRPGGGLAEIMVDIEWNSARRAYETNVTYEAVAAGLKGSSTTTNTWLVDIIS